MTEDKIDIDVVMCMTGHMYVQLYAQLGRAATEYYEHKSTTATETIRKRRSHQFIHIMHLCTLTCRSLQLTTILEYKLYSVGPHNRTHETPMIRTKPANASPPSGTATGTPDVCIRNQTSYLARSNTHVDLSGLLKTCMVQSAKVFEYLCDVKFV